jgi:hypothetical protein
MNQTLSISKTSFMDKNSELALSMIHKTPYEQYELYYREKTAAILCDPYDKLYDYNDDIKALQLQ